MKPKSQQIMIKLSLFFVQLLALIPSYLTSEIFQSILFYGIFDMLDTLDILIYLIYLIYLTRFGYFVTFW